jgi:hypothetical protein
MTFVESYFLSISSDHSLAEKSRGFAEVRDRDRYHSIWPARNSVPNDCVIDDLYAAARVSARSVDLLGVSHRRRRGHFSLPWKRLAIKQTDYRANKIAALVGIKKALRRSGRAYELPTSGFTSSPDLSIGLCPRGLASESQRAPE